ncbi:uncharacterized protein isoform X2 [Musca autumnalis]|uniref:uncharacterized protein isoform X2 n=1 Tax=Musca autumnalis TaxID=221902 RepID=UPI003CE71F18
MDKKPTLEIQRVGKQNLKQYQTNPLTPSPTPPPPQLSSSSPATLSPKSESISTSSTSGSSPKSTKRRHRLQRSRDNFDSDDVVEPVLTTPAQEGPLQVLSVMGGGFVTPPTAAYTKDYIDNAVTTVALPTNLSNNETKKTTKNTPEPPPTTKEQQMHEKLLENDGCDKNPPSGKTEKVKHKPHKESKFAEKLRRSFRRAEHKSLEIKRQDKIDAERCSSLRPLHQQLQNSASIFSLTNLPGLGGHINPALLLDSPDESTPPEFSYRHLSSVATTNSSTSLESNFCESPTTSISYWAWHMNNNNMGGEVSTHTNPNSNNTNNRNLNAPTQQELGSSGVGSRNKRLEQQSSSKSDQGGGGSEHPNVTADSRSCSTASESSTAAKLTKLQNFLFKSSNESSRSIQGHSNEGFTISSFNSSSGEWENLCNFPSTSQNVTLTEDSSQFPLSTEEESGHKKENLSDSNGSLRNYYQYTLASPSNPFLPEITARTYHSTYEEEEEDRELEEELDSNVTSVKYRIGCHSAQLPTPNYSRTGSQESTHSDYAGGAYGGSTARYDSSNSSLCNAATTTTSTPGKHKRKLFSLSTPTKLDFPNTTTAQVSSSNSQASQQSNVSKTSSSCNLVRSLNPFLPSTTVTSSSPPQRTSSSSSLNKQQRMGPFKQQAVTSPIAIPGSSNIMSTHGHHGSSSGSTQMSGSGPLKDLNARREEFLKATMQICLVVSPPSSRLQLKSKSLTHLDGLESEMVCNHAKNSNTTLASITSTLSTAYPLSSPSSLSPPLPQYHAPSGGSNVKPQPQQQRPLSPVRSSLHPKLYSSTRLAASRRTPTIYTQAPQQPPQPSALAPNTTKSLPNNLNSPTSLQQHHHHHPLHHHHHPYQGHYEATLSSCNTTTTTSACCHSRICSSHIGSAPCSSSNLLQQQQMSSHHHYHTNKFQSDVVASSASNVATTTISSSSPSSSSQHTLKPLALPLPPTADNNATIITSYGSLGAADQMGSGSISSTSSLYPYSHGGGGGGLTPTSTTSTTLASHKKKSSFLQRKKPILTRSEVSSSEYFLVSFCNESGCQDEEFFPATKGVTLANALSQALRKRNLSFSQLTITDSYDNNQPSAFLEAGTSPLQTSLDENTEVENLAGHHLFVNDKDSTRKTLQKAASFGSRARPPRLLSSASTDESSEINITGKQPKQRWSGLFGVKNPQQSQLCELLNSYSKNGVPQKTPATLNFDHPDLDNAIEYLDKMHKSWTDIVECGGMNDAEMRIQTAIWELVTTEVDYIHCLQTVTDLFLACLESAQEEGLLKEVDQHRLFANIRDICEANLKFWTLYLYPMVAHSIQTREPLRYGFFQPGFIAFANLFAPYKKYCAEQSSCQFYCKELNRTNSVFTSYLAWCEAQKMCNRLRLADILVRPMQRLTKYSLLLTAIKKHMTDIEEIEALETMIHTTENFVFSVNNHLTTRQENERLKGVMARIESYDVVDTNNEHLEKMIKQYSQMFDLCAPMKGCASQHVRHLFMEGDHKYKDNLGKADVHCFLLTDMLLVCKSIAKKGLGTLKVIRQPYLTDRLIVQHSNNILSCVYLNEFQVAVNAFTLQCSEAQKWYEALKRARVIYTRLKQSSISTATNWEGMRFGGSMISAGTVDSLGVKKSPLNSSICSHVTSANNSHSGSVEWNDSRNISVEFDKTNSLSSDEGCAYLGAHGFPLKGKPVTTISPQKLKVNTSSSNTLTVQPLNHLGQSLPNLNLHHSHTNNTLLVPGAANTSSTQSGNLLLSPSHRGISYPPPSPTRVPLRRGMAFSSSIKYPPLLKTRNITSQNSINWHQIPATPTPTSPQSQHTSPSRQALAPNTPDNVSVTSNSSSNLAVNTLTESEAVASGSSSQQQQQQSNPIILSTQLSNSTETDV